MMVRDLVSQLRRDEGECLHAYQDHLGLWTIGVGRLIDPKRGGGITRDESAYLLANDVAEVRRQVADRLPWTAQLDEARQGALCNMAFQMGIDGLCGFKTALDYLRNGKTDEAASAFLQSLWAKQTPERAKRVTEQIRTGGWV